MTATLPNTQKMGWFDFTPINDPAISFLLPNYCFVKPIMSQRYIVFNSQISFDETLSSPYKKRTADYAPKGQRIPAQGETLGQVWRNGCVLKERRIIRGRVGDPTICGVPSERGNGWAMFPQSVALGWYADAPLGLVQGFCRCPWCREMSMGNGKEISPK